MGLSAEATKRMSLIDVIWVNQKPQFARMLFSWCLLVDFHPAFPFTAYPGFLPAATAQFPHNSSRFLKLLAPFFARLLGLAKKAVRFVRRCPVDAHDEAANYASHGSEYHGTMIT